MIIKSLEAASRWAPACQEYFEAFQGGVYDEFNYLDVILPLDKLHANPERGDLVVGYAGVDGIYFCFREGEAGIWAYYGIDDRYVLMASTLADFVERWMSREIVL